MKSWPWNSGEPTQLDRMEYLLHVLLKASYRLEIMEIDMSLSQQDELAIVSRLKDAVVSATVALTTNNARFEELIKQIGDPALRAQFDLALADADARIPALANAIAANTPAAPAPVVVTPPADNTVAA